MTTKDTCFSSSKKKLFARDSSSSDQYSNLNLNQNHKCLISGDSDSLLKHSKTFENKEATNYDFSHKNNDSQRKSTSFSSLNMPSSKYNIQSNGEKGKKEDGKNDDFESAANKKSRSTLSLHIAAYENFIEGFSGSDSFIDKHENDKSDSLLKDEKQIFVNSSFITQNPFEFPRQQQSEIGIKPEISQFKASQKLFNPNASASSPEGFQISSKSNSQHSQHHGRNSHPKNHHHYHQNGGGGHRSHHYHNNNHHHQNLNNYGGLDVIVHENKMYVPSMFHAVQETSLAMTAIRYKQNEIEQHRALAMGRKLSSSSSQNNFSPPSSYQQNPAPTWLPLIRVFPFTTPQMQSENVKDNKKHQHNHNQYQQQQQYHQQFQQSDDFFEGISSTLDDDNVFLPSGISPLKLDKKSSMKHVVSSNSFDLSPTNSLSPALSHSDTLSPNEQLHVPLDSIFHGTTKKFNKKTYRKRKAVVAGKAISLADLESKLIGTTEKEHE